MSARPATSLEQSVGRIEGQLVGVIATLERVDHRSAVRDEEIRAMRSDIADLKLSAEAMAVVKKDFNALQQFIHDTKVEAKGVSKGLVLGVSLAASTSGILVATFAKNLWIWLTSFFGG